MYIYICIQILINFCCIIFWHRERDSDLPCFLMSCDVWFHLLFFFLWSLPLEITSLSVPNFVTPSQNRWKILGNRPFLWLILRGCFLFVSDDTAHHQRKCFSFFVKIAKGNMVVLVESLFWAVVENHDMTLWKNGLKHGAFSLSDVRSIHWGETFQVSHLMSFPWKTL